MIACGLDFGTSNSAIGVLLDGEPTLAPVERDATLIPSAVFYEQELPRRILFGAGAIAAHIEGVDGRLMRALKTILGSSLINERTMLGKRRVALTDVVEVFLRHLKAKAEDYRGAEITAVVHGRPVRFVDGNDAADAKAEAVLERIARRIGFKEVHFVYEPIAAALHYEESTVAEELVLVADIGGGTSDFSVIRVGPQRRRLVERTEDVLANGGTRIGGTDFDTLLSLEAVMPFLGRGTNLIAKDLPMPNGIFFDLATWPTINLCYTHAIEREVRAMLADAREPEKVARLYRTIHERFGHRIAFAVEDAKMALSDVETAPIGLAFLDRTLALRTTRAAFDAAIRDKTERLHQVASGCIADAGLTPHDIDAIFFTGGSSRVPAVRRAISLAAPQARAISGSDLLSVATGLTREAERRFGG